MSKEKLEIMRNVYVITSPAASHIEQIYICSNIGVLQDDQDVRNPGFEASPGAKVQMHGLAPDSHTPGSMHA
eukprot:7992762-Pyramimonas_sp.AAC.1